MGFQAHYKEKKKARLVKNVCEKNKILPCTIKFFSSWLDSLMNLPDDLRRVIVLLHLRTEA